MTHSHSISKSESEQEELTCPICLLPDQPLVITSCSHKACLHCFERILLTTNPGSNYYTMTENEQEDEERIEDTIICHCPTRGRCPFCRLSINMFDLRKQAVTDHENNDNQDLINQLESVYDPIISMKDTSLNNLKFSDIRKSRTISFVDGIPELWILGENKDEEEVERKQCFESGFYYHDKSKTFSGIIDWTKVRFKKRT